MLNGRAGEHLRPDGTGAVDGVLLLILNAHHDPVPFTLPKWEGGQGWRPLLDTGNGTGAPSPAIAPAGQPVAVAGRSTLLFELVEGLAGAGGAPGGGDLVTGGNRMAGGAGGVDAGA
jgi:glycogen operon protein